MSIRITLLTIMVIGLAIYAWRDWFVSLCGLILLMAVIEHPDMPKNIMGIQGLNPWNILMAAILLAWFMTRQREGLVWDMPGYLTVMLLLYLGVVLVAFVRMITDRTGLGNQTLGYLVSENLINCIKWVIPGLLLFDGCRTRRRLLMALGCTLGLYFLLAVQVAKWMPPSTALSGGELTLRAGKIIQNEIGYHRVNMSMMLAGASWAILATTPLVKKWQYKALIVLAALLTAYGQALTAGRAGYATWGVVGFILCTIRWRKYLLLLPVVPLVISLAMPGVVDRMLMGFGATNVAGDTYTDDYEVTAGRTLIWPEVIDKISESPGIGYGKLAMKRTGLAQYLLTQYGESFPHPHNAYLQMLLDNGIVGFALVMPFYGMVLFHAGRLFLDRRNPTFAAIGGVTLALVLALLVASIGSQTFYPREGAVGMWAAIFLMLRVSLERSRLYAPMPRPAAVRAVPAGPGSQLALQKYACPSPCERGPAP